MVSKINNMNDNTNNISSGEKTGAGHPHRDVFTHLYKDAEVKQQQRKQQQQQQKEQYKQQQQKELIWTGRTNTRNEIIPIAPQRSNSHLVDLDASTSSILPGITPFVTNKRIDKLALPRGPDHTTITPRTPNYGRLLNFTEEEARENKQHHHHISRHPPRVTIPTSNPRINQLSTPRLYMGSTLICQKNSFSLGQDERQEYQTPRRRSSTPMRRGYPVFRFK